MPYTDPRRRRQPDGAQRRPSLPSIFDQLPLSKPSGKPQGAGQPSIFDLWSKPEKPAKPSPRQSPGTVPTVTEQGDPGSISGALDPLTKPPKPSPTPSIIIPGGGGSPGGTGTPPPPGPGGWSGGGGGGGGGGGTGPPPKAQPPTLIPVEEDLPPGLIPTTTPGTQVPGAEHLGQVPDMPGATLWDVTGDELVEKRMEDLLDSGSPVLQAWQEATRRAHARYGGQNSLMANQAAVAGMMQMAFSIASADAATIARSREFNAAMSNQYGLANLAFMHNALLSDQNFRQAQIIQQEQLAAQLRQARIAAGVQMAAINADMTIAREGFAHQIEMAGINHGYAQSLMGSEYALMMGRDTNLANLDVRNLLLGQTNQADLNLRNQAYLSEQGYQHELGTMQYGAGLQDWRASQDFQRQRILNYDQYRITQAGDAASMLTNLAIQPGMSDRAIGARINDLYAIWGSLGLMGDSYYLNGTANDDSYPDYFTYPRPPGSRGSRGAGPGG